MNALFATASVAIALLASPTSAQPQPGGGGAARPAASPQMLTVEECGELDRRASTKGQLAPDEQVKLIECAMSKPGKSKNLILPDNKFVYQPRDAVPDWMRMLREGRGGEVKG
jgi:hypothetical protein